MALACDCCGHPSAEKHHGFKACNMCKPRKPEERYKEAYVREGNKTGKAKVRETIYECTSPICSNKRRLGTQVVVLEWLE